MDEKNKIYNALDIARYIINYSIDNSYPVSNLKLQKLLYYVQANFLVNKNKQCFYQEILNWDYGQSLWTPIMNLEDMVEIICLIKRLMEQLNLMEQLKI